MSLILQTTQQENRRLHEEVIPGIIENSSHSSQQLDNGNSAHASHASLPNAENNSRSYQIRIDKWGLEFDGNANKLAVEDFVFRVERLQRQYGVSWTEVLDNSHIFVKGVAEKWYWLYKTNYVTEWATLKAALLKQYQSTRSSFEIMSDIVERRQLPNESLDAYFFAMS